MTSGTVHSGNCGFHHDQNRLAPTPPVDVECLKQGTLPGGFKLRNLQICLFRHSLLAHVAPHPRSSTAPSKQRRASTAATQAAVLRCAASKRGHAANLGVPKHSWAGLLALLLLGSVGQAYVS